MSRIYSLFILPLLFVFGFSGAESVFSREIAIEEQLDHYIQSLPEPFNGTILMSVGDDILVNKGYGLANRSYAIPNTAETKYRIGSITKHFTAILTLQLAQQGLIDLDAAIENYLPYCPEQFKGKITIRHLLTHKSGIPHHYNAFSEYFGVEDRFFHTSMEYLKLLDDVELAHEPGEKMTYTSPGYHLLGIVLESATDKSYAELLEENILMPLGMKNTSVYNNLTIHENMATGYQEGLNGYVLSWDEEESLRTAAGSVLTTSKDLHLFLKTFSLEGDEILSEEYKKVFFQCHSPGFSCAGVTYLDYPCNDGKETISAVTTGGSSYGFQCYIERLIDRDASFIVLSNIQSGPIAAMGSEIDNTILLTKLNIDIGQNEHNDDAWNTASIEIAHEDLADYTGVYRLDNEGYVVVSSENGKLFSIESIRQSVGIFSFGNIFSRKLFPVSNNLFNVEGLKGAQYRFTKNPGENEFDIEVLRNDQHVGEAKRVKSVAGFNISEYSGYYYSTELQKTYLFSIEGDHLISSGFPDTTDSVFVPLKKDMFGFSQGYLIFHRYEDGTIRDFKLQTPQVDDAVGSLFLKK